MQNFEKPKSFCSIDIYPLFMEKPAVAKKIFQIIMALVNEKKLFVPQPFKVYGISELEDVLRLFQSGKNSGKMSVEMRKKDLVQVSFTH